MAKQIIKSEMTLKRAMEIISNPDEFPSGAYVEAYSIILIAKNELDETVKSSESNLIGKIGEDFFEVIVRNNNKVSIDKEVVTSVSLTKTQKDIIYSDPDKFADYISPQIIPAKVKADVIAGKFPEKTFVASTLVKAKVKTSKVK